jgi:hypothetical protein
MGVVMLTERAIAFLFYSMLRVGSKGHCSRQGSCDISIVGSGHAALESVGLAPIANPQLFYNRYKNRDSDKKEGQPFWASLPVSD